MADPVLKFPPEQKGTPPAKPRAKIAAEPRRRLMAAMRRYRRAFLLVVLPLVALIAGLVFYLNGGRYVTTDDAYVGAQKVLITPDISGKIEKVVVREGQHVSEGDVLFEIDPVPFRLAVQQAKANLDQTRITYDNLVANIKIYSQMFDLAQQGVDLKQRDVDRKSSLVKSNVGSQLDLDNSATGLVTASAQLELLKQQISTAKTQLLGNPDLPLEQFPPYAQAKAALDQAERNLDHTADARADGRHRDAGRPDPARPFRRRRHAGVQHHRHLEAVGRRQSEGIGFHLCRGRPAGFDRGRRVPGSRLQGHRRLAEPRHRRAIRDPAAAERHRQFRQGGAARAGANLFRQRRQARAEAEGRHERLYHDRHRPPPFARRPVRLRAGGKQD